MNTDPHLLRSALALRAGYAARYAALDATRDLALRWPIKSAAKSGDRPKEELNYRILCPQ
jgi:hypothetical protein